MAKRSIRVVKYSQATYKQLCPTQKWDEEGRKKMTLGFCCRAKNVKHIGMGGSGLHTLGGSLI